MKKKLLPILLFAFLFAVLITYLAFQDYNSLFVHVWNLIPPFFASATALYAMKVYNFDNPHAKALGFLSLGIFFWFIGELIWFVMEFFLNSYPFPSVADLFYLMAYPTLLIGLIIEFENHKMKWTPLRLTICISKSIIFGILVIYFGIIKAYDPEVDLVGNVIAMSYGVGDLILIMLSSSILMITLSYKKGKLFLPWIFIFSGFLFILVSDILFAIYQNEYENFLNYARNIDIGWIIGFLLLGYGFYKIGESVEEVKKKLLGNR